MNIQSTTRIRTTLLTMLVVAAFVAVPSAFSTAFITDTLGGNGSAKATPDAFERAVAIHNAGQAQQAQGVRFITDTLGGNGGVAASTTAPGSSGLDWSALGMGIGLGVLLSGVLLAVRSIGRTRRLAHS